MNPSHQLQGKTFPHMSANVLVEYSSSLLQAALDNRLISVSLTLLGVVLLLINLPEITSPPIPPQSQTIIIYPRLREITHLIAYL